MAARVSDEPRTGEGGSSTASNTQTLSRGGELQAGRARSSSPRTALLEVAHPGTHPIHLPPPPMVAPPRGTPRTPISPVTLGGKGYSRGRCPVSRFPWILRSVKLPRFLTHNGNSPDSRLFARDSCVRLARFPSSDGIGPVSLLPWRNRCVRLARFPSSDGTDPVSPLPWMDRPQRLDRFPSSDGIGPLRLLFLRDSCVRLDRFPSSDGIGPLRLLVLSKIPVRLDRFPSSGGSVPFNPRLARRMTKTRGGVPPVEIPCQLDIGVVAFQLRVPVPRRVSFSPQRTLQSLMSPVFV